MLDSRFLVFAVAFWRVPLAEDWADDRFPPISDFAAYSDVSQENERVFLTIWRCENKWATNEPELIRKACQETFCRINGDFLT